MDWLDDYLRWLALNRAYAKRTTAEHRKAVLHFNEHLGRCPEDATVVEVHEYLMREEIMPSTRWQYRAKLRVYFDWVVERGLRPDNPAREIKLPQPKRTLPRPAPDEVVLSALGNGTPSLRLMTALSAFQGLRVSEIAAFDTRWVQSGSFRVPAMKGVAERIMPVHPVTVAKMADARVLEDEPTRYWANKPWQVRHHLARYLKVISARTGNTHTSPHMLRHWFGTMAYGDTGRLIEVKEWLGHQQVTTTMGYVAVSNAQDPEAMANVGVKRLSELKVVEGANFAQMFRQGMEQQQ